MQKNVSQHGNLHRYCDTYSWQPVGSGDACRLRAVGRVN